MKFSYSKMDACCTEMQVAVNNIKEALDDVNTICNELSKNGSWSGQASTFYLDKMSKLTNQFDDIKLELDQIVQYLRNTIASYQSIEYNIESALKNVLNVSNW